MQLSNALTGLFIGAGLVVGISWLLSFWKPGPEGLIKKMAVGTLLRFACVALIAVWGFQSNFAAGLTAIVAFGFGFLVITLIEYQRSFKKLGVSEVEPLAVSEVEPPGKLS